VPPILTEPLEPVVAAPAADDERRRADALGSILRTLAYFDVFRHPLTSDEVLAFSCADQPRASEVKDLLLGLHRDQLIANVGAYWGLRITPADVQARHEDAARAEARMPRARRMARRIASTPFVRAVFVSGSLSKGRLAPDGDIDFFIITAPGRLWLARTLLIAYKKLFLLNSRRDFCINYFLDTDHLKVEDRNRFTATEVVTLMGLQGNGTRDAFFRANQWAFDLLPAARVAYVPEVRTDGAVKAFWERLFGGSFGEALDSWSMMLTWHYWRWKFNDMDPRTFDLALRTRTYVSKHHPRDFQRRVLDAYEERLRELELRSGRSLS
jgi:predicted nucleotidyltransferase